MNNQKFIFHFFIIHKILKYVKHFIFKNILYSNLNTMYSVYKYNICASYITPFAQSFAYYLYTYYYILYIPYIVIIYKFGDTYCRYTWDAFLSNPL